MKFLTEPHASVPGGERKRARLFSALLLLLIPFGGLSIFLIVIGVFRPDYSSVPGTIALLLVYGLSRTRYYRIAIGLALASMSTAILLTVFAEIESFFLYFLAIPILLASLFVSIHAMIVFLGLNLGAIFLFQMLSPSANLSSIALFMFTFGLLAIAIDRVRLNDQRQIEAQMLQAQQLYSENIRILGELVEVMMGYARMDFSQPAAVSGDNDLFDALATGINIMGEEVQARIAELESLTVELRLARDQAESANRAKSEFISSMSHELRTPLNTILGYAQILEMDADTLPPGAVKGVQQIEASGRHLLEMVTKLLDFSRSEVGKITLDLQTVNASAAIQDVWETLSPTAKAKRIHLTLNLPRRPCIIHADPLRLAQILQTLIRNAIEFTPEDGQVRIQCSREAVSNHPTADKSSSANHWCLFTVSDSGIGLSAEQIPLLFQPLTQMDSSHTRTHHGLGLELALAHRLVELHGGHIWAESLGENMGSTFSFEIPLED